MIHRPRHVGLTTWMYARTSRRPLGDGGDRLTMPDAAHGVTLSMIGGSSFKPTRSTT